MQRMAARYERRVIPVAENEIGAEEAPEEHDFRQKEQPHAKRSGLALLGHVLEVMAQKRRMLVFDVDRLGRLSGNCVAIQR